MSDPYRITPPPEHPEDTPPPREARDGRRTALWVGFALSLAGNGVTSLLGQHVLGALLGVAALGFAAALFLPLLRRGR